MCQERGPVVQAKMAKKNGRVAPNLQIIIIADEEQGIRQEGGHKVGGPCNISQQGECHEQVKKTKKQK